MRVATETMSVLLGPEDSGVRIQGPPTRGAVVDRDEGDYATRQGEPLL